MLHDVIYVQKRDLELPRLLFCSSFQIKQKYKLCFEMRVTITLPSTIRTRKNDILLDSLYIKPHSKAIIQRPFYLFQWKWHSHITMYL